MTELEKILFETLEDCIQEEVLDVMEAEGCDLYDALEEIGYL